ncbi:hypothetical protein [Halochromatium salexigens]|uniref:hypothetical protein n=1 Tax=Halochromatium salexigens TaxID=49447 RepID=UPI001913E64C|nr:hypothetical protein [Halochromatium salexigens]
MSSASQTPPAGIEVFGIGIQQEVGPLFPGAMRIEAIADLEWALVEVAEAVLLSPCG